MMQRCHGVKRSPLYFEGVDGPAAEDGGDHQGSDDGGAGGPLLSARLGLQGARAAGEHMHVGVESAAKLARMLQES